MLMLCKISSDKQCYHFPDLHYLVIITTGPIVIINRAPSRELPILTEISSHGEMNELCVMWLLNPDLTLKTWMNVTNHSSMWMQLLIHALNSTRCWVNYSLSLTDTPWVIQMLGPCKLVWQLMNHWQLKFFMFIVIFCHTFKATSRTKVDHMGSHFPHHAYLGLIRIE